jgi:hypothetical protein
MDILCGSSIQSSQLNNKGKQRKVSEVIFFINIFAEVIIYFDTCEYWSFGELRRDKSETEE